MAIVLAGGVGARMGASVPKQLLRIAGKPIVEHTIEALESSPDVDEIIVMMEEHHLGEIDALRASGRFPKLSAVRKGGSTRNESTARALASLGPEEAKVLIHDAVRPFLDDRIVRECVEALDSYDAVDTAIASADTIIEVSTDDDGREFIRDVPQRSSLRRGQTPQAFRLSVIRRAYELAAADPGFTATDDCTVVLRYLPHVPIAVVRGAEENMKITEPVDISVADKIFQLRTGPIEVLGDATRFRALAGSTVVVFGGSQGIGASVCELASRYGARVFSFSRATTGTHVEHREQVADALAHAAAATGRVDFVVNAAAVLDISPLMDVDAVSVRRIIDIDLHGPIIVAQEAYPHLVRSQGQLMFFTSSSYTRGRAGYSLYSACKSAIVNLTQALSEEWSDAGVRVNCINPQRTRTPMRERAFGDEPDGTLLTPEKVAERTVDVLSSSITGQVIDVRQA
ncbi:MAG TPA: bifunctional cytidylyltransferase/SDR family oxidoreductase [Naasia sp.]